MPVTATPITFPLAGGPPLPLTQYLPSRRALMVFAGFTPCLIGMIASLLPAPSPTKQILANGDFRLDYEHEKELTWQIWFGLWGNGDTVTVYEEFASTADIPSNHQSKLDIKGTLTVPTDYIQAWLDGLRGV